MTGKLAGKVALITGGGSGIGRASAELFTAEGAAVAVVDLKEEAAQETVDKIAADGGRAVAIRADVSNAEEIAAAVARTVSELGRLDVVYNNAGIGSAGSVADAEEDDWDRCFNVNAKGTFLTSRAAVPHLEASGAGAIINQGSVAALVGVANFAAYCAAKGAVVALTRSMAVDLAPRGIRVNVICPGTVYTPLMEPMLKARGGGDMEKGLAMTVASTRSAGSARPEIARVALFLASEDAAFVTGSTFAADGGMTAQ